MEYPGTWDIYLRASPSSKPLAVDGVVVPSVPLRERVRYALLVLLVVPLQHVRVERDVRLLAEGPDGRLGLVEEVVGVEHGDGNLAFACLGAIGSAGHGWAHEPLLSQVVE